MRSSLKNLLRAAKAIAMAAFLFAIPNSTSAQCEADVSVDAVPQVIYSCYGPQCATLIADANHGEPPFTFEWSNGQTGSQITVCPTQTTTYTVTMTDAAGCIASRSVTVTVIDACCKDGKVLLCHNGHTICVAPEAVEAHLAHGATLGGCF